jgi:glycosyltransferase involved in cell wall biosynthesis
MTVPTTAPRVTIGMTLYNVERYLPDALDAALAQDFTDFEIVACDNLSTDRTWAIISDYAARDHRIRASRNDRNLGMAGNFRRVVESARGDFFRLTSHDDLFAPTLLSRCVAALDAAGPGVVLAYPRTRLIDGAGADLGPWRDRGESGSRWAWRRVGSWGANWNLCNELFGVIRTDVLRETHLLSDASVSPDVILLTELALRGRFVEVPEELFFRRMHAGGTHQGDRTLAEVAEYLEPERKTRNTRRFALSRETSSALRQGTDVPAATRYVSLAAYTASYGLRRVRSRIRRALGTPTAPAPWQTPRG